MAEKLTPSMSHIDLIKPGLTEKLHNLSSRTFITTNSTDIFKHGINKVLNANRGINFLRVNIKTILTFGLPLIMVVALNRSVNYSLLSPWHRTTHSASNRQYNTGCYRYPSHTNGALPRLSMPQTSQECTNVQVSKKLFVWENVSPTITRI